MDYNEFLFSQLFMVLLSVTTRELTYDQIHPVLSKVYAHWLSTDELYGRFDHECTYDAIERYIKEHHDHIRLLLLGDD